jgi:hypothetical protein
MFGDNLFQPACSITFTVVDIFSNIVEHELGVTTLNNIIDKCGQENIVPNPIYSNIVTIVVNY